MSRTALRSLKHDNDSKPKNQSAASILDVCQLMQSRNIGTEPAFWYVRRRMRNAWRRLRRLLHLHSRSVRVDRVTRGNTLSQPIQLTVGDCVRVRTLAEIADTLDQHNRLHGCAFLKPMARYCGQQFRVARVVNRFFDEARWRMVQCRNVVLLEGVYCDGSGHPDTHGCDRMCFLFWRTEWLMQIHES